jgi:hypothetical protein
MLLFAWRGCLCQTQQRTARTMAILAGILLLEELGVRLGLQAHTAFLEVVGAAAVASWLLAVWAMLLRSTLLASAFASAFAAFAIRTSSRQLCLQRLLTKPIILERRCWF